jgi:hypothetical protein
VTTRLLMSALAALLVIALVPAAASAFPTKLSPNGQVDFNYGSTVESAGGAATAYKPENKLFYTGNGSSEAIRWWAVLATSGPSPAAGVHLWQLVNHAWVESLRLPGADPWAKADTVFDGSTLYVSTRDNKSTGGGNPRESDLYEIPYLGNGSWGSVSGPFSITTDDLETLTIAKDSTDRLWATYELGRNIRVGYTAPGGTSFTFFTVSQAAVMADDISVVTAFAGNIGVYWSDQNAKKDFFAVHSDSSAPASGWSIETAYGGGVGGCPTANSDLCADDHMNVKVSGDQVFVAVKTSLNNVAGGANDPLIVLLRRSSSGSWSSFPVSTVSQDATRPITLLSPSQDKIWVWATRSGEVDAWESSFTSPGFNSGAFTPWAKGGGSANNSTSTRQVVTATSGAVVEVSVSGKREYWHNEFLPTGGPPPNTAPTAQNATVSTDTGTPTNVTLTGTDPESCELTFIPSATSANGGTVGSLNSPGNNCTAGTPNMDTASVTYTPPGGFTGADTFTFKVNDGIDDSNTATVTVNVGGPPPTTIQLRSSSSAANGNATTLQIAAPPGVQSGDVLVAEVAVRMAPTITPPSGWILIRTDVTGTPQTQAAYYKIAGASEPTSYTWTFSSSEAAAGGILAYTGVSTSNPIDAQGGQVNAKSTLLTAPSITTTSDGDALVAFFDVTQNNSVTPPGSMTERFDLATTGSMPFLTAEGADEIQATAGSTGTRVATASLAGKSIGQLIALRPGP